MVADRIVFMGSPQFAVPSLAVLAERFDVVAVVTQPDSLAGRGRRPSAPPVKRAAEALGLPVWQPPRLRGREAIEHLRSLRPDCVVVAAYGEILPPRVLALASKGFVNVHASLLPKYRGASPIAAAILAGEAETGVSIMLLDAGMDTGPVLAEEAIAIASDDSRGSLEEKLAQLGADLLARTLPGWLAGESEPRPQDHERATCTRPLTRADGRIDWARPAAHIERLCRAMDPWPGAYTAWQGKTLKVLRGRVLAATAGAAPGTVVRRGDAVAVACGEGLLELVSVQPEGRAAMPAEAFARGRPQFVGSTLGD